MEDASLLWRYEEDDLSVAAGVVANNGERLVIAGSSGDLLSLDTGTGQVISRRKFADAMDSDPKNAAWAIAAIRLASTSSRPARRTSPWRSDASSPPSGRRAE